MDLVRLGLLVPDLQKRRKVRIQVPAQQAVHANGFLNAQMFAQAAFHLVGASFEARFFSIKDPAVAQAIHAGL